MTNDEKLDLILGTVQDIKSKTDSLEVQVEQAKTGFGKVVTKLEQVEIRLEQVETRLEQVETRLDHVETRLDQVEHGLAFVKMSMENEIRPNIMRVAEGHLDLHRHMGELSGKMNRVVEKYEMYDLYIRYHDSEIRNLNHMAGL